VQLCGHLLHRGFLIEDLGSGRDDGGHGNVRHQATPEGVAQHADLAHLSLLVLRGGQVGIMFSDDS
jgi:hypothetical protein